MSRISIPIQHISNRHKEIYTRDTIVQWIEDPQTREEKYRMKINIEGFKKNEVSIRVEGNRLYVYGERIENKTQGTSKKIIEKYYNLPADIDTSRPHITFPSSMIVQVDFSALSSNRSIPIPVRSDVIQEENLSSSSSSSSLSTIASKSSSIFPSNFDSQLFYQSIFQPEILIDDENHRYIEFKLDVHNSNPDDIKVSLNDNDLIVQIDQTNFYKQITLPSNIDASSLTIHHHHDRKVYITIRLLDEHSSFKYF